MESDSDSPYETPISFDAFLRTGAIPALQRRAFERWLKRDRGAALDVLRPAEWQAALARFQSRPTDRAA